MNVHDPDDPQTDPGRTSSPLPRRTTALDAHGPVPAPRTPGDGPVRPRPTPAPVVPTARHGAPPAPTPRHEAPPPSSTARPEAQAPTARHEVSPPCTPPMPWSAVAAPAALPPAPRASGHRSGRSRPAWWPEVRRVLARPTVERRVAAGLAVTVVLVGSAALVLGLVAQPPADEQVVAQQQAEQQAAAPAADDVADGATVVDPGAFGGDVLRFRSPTGNIECRMADDGSRCTIGTRGWTLPPAAPDCPPANGTVVLSGSGPAFASCEPSSARSASSLDYDRALRRGEVTCVSRRDGVECRDAGTGHGFAIARADYRVY